ncbi:hypothetical protein ETN89_00155 [Photobacterium damselae subsp. damselae]|uniref:DUF5666 domain-containing protein n=1 Tax=Photobacterium damselae TaxID=38293 RepID=UPI000A2FD19F|nr:DUF5666 domain-containing protein [Photobacterium damselae]ARR48984.1 hypothetical protein CAY62_04925 [Photobacterium damselae subsp. damselae]QAY33987.1 hypothetical protein ETN89_00155 [Photobacterium damselae subsp. damselae]
MKKLALVTIIGLILSGCGGGGGDNGSTPKPVITPEAKPALVEGTIDTVNDNNITVNGRSYRVAKVHYANASLADGVSILKPQMMVQVSDVAKSGATVFLDPTLLGKVTAVNHTTHTFTVNGVELSFAQLNKEIDKGDWVMVSALPMATDTGVGYKVLSVIKVENTDLVGMYELEGTVSQLDSEAFTFKLGQVVVDYSNIQLKPMIGNGDWVEVTGQMLDGVFGAEEVEVDNYDNEDFADAEIEGVVTWINQKQTLFTLNARGQFVIDNSTRFEDGTQHNLKTGTLVEVTAINGVAKEIEFERDHDGDHDQGTWHSFHDVKGTVSNVTGSTITLDTFNGASQIIYVDNMTRYEDRLTLATLTGKRVEIEGIVRNGQKIAREIELDN